MQFDYSVIKMPRISPWFIHATWQNFSSLVREATTAQEAGTGMERSHHLTASLYFGIAALEAFLNEKMRTHLDPIELEENIVDALRKTKLITKVKSWPEEIIGKELTVSKGTLHLITFFNGLRGELTHPKTRGHEVYAKLQQVDPVSIISSVGEYIARYHEAEGSTFPYWLFGWNYLNPRPNSYEIILINDQQFRSSILALRLGGQVEAYSRAEQWRSHYLGTFHGYEALRKALDLSTHCEPKSSLFPFQPILCRRWWTGEHHSSCGHVTGEALDYVRNRAK